MQGKLAEAYFFHKQIEEIIHIYEETRDKTCSGQYMNQKRIPSDVVEKHWQRSIYLFFLDVAFTDIETHLSQEKRSHNERCWLIHGVVVEHDENKILRYQEADSLNMDSHLSKKICSNENPLKMIMKSSFNNT